MSIAESFAELCFDSDIQPSKVDSRLIQNFISFVTRATLLFHVFLISYVDRKLANR